MEGQGIHPMASEPRPTVRQSHSSDGPRCLVVMYHYVHDVEPIALPRRAGEDSVTGIPALTTAQFRHQLDQLCAGLEPMDWPTLYASLRETAALPHRSFLLTFDDGLADHAEIVAPILQEYGLRGTFFVPGSILLSHRLLSAHALQLLLSILEPNLIEKEVCESLRRDGVNPTTLTGAADVTELARQVYHYESPDRARLKYLLNMMIPSGLRDITVQYVFEKHIGSATRWAKHWYLGWDDLVELQNHGHTIGGHGFRHEPLTRLNALEAMTDLTRAKKTLDEGLGVDPRPFSYPFGRHDDPVASACRKAGFVHGFTTDGRWLTGADDLLRLPRVDVIHVGRVLSEVGLCTSA